MNEFKIVSGKVNPILCAAKASRISLYFPSVLGTLWILRQFKMFMISLEHLEQIPTIKLTFVQAAFVLATSVGICNLAGTDPILMKL